MKNRGYTIVELLVVVLVIGLLSTMVSLEYINKLKNNRDTKRKADLKSISVALEMYRNDQSNINYQKYPFATSSTSLNPKNKVIDAFNYLTDTNINGLGYFTNITDDPLTPDKKYFYIVESSGVDFKLSAKLEADDSAMKNDGGISEQYYEVFSSGGSNLATP